MWKHMARIICEVRPRYVFVENSPMLTSRGLDTVLADLAAMGFDAQWGVVSAADVGANHKRERIWILANSKLHGRIASKIGGCVKETIRQKQDGPLIAFDAKGASCISTSKSDVADSNITQCKRNECTQRGEQEHPDFGSSSWWSSEPNVGRVANGVAARVDRLKAIGNGQVPLCVATAWELLK
jgi:DNA (cytosine-5)-methyltransferase 1